MLDTSLRRRRPNNLAERLYQLETNVFSEITTAFRRISLDVTIGKIADLTAGVIRIIGTGEVGNDAILIDASQTHASIRSDNYTVDNDNFISFGFNLQSRGGVSFSSANIKNLQLDITDNYLLIGRGKGETVEYLPPVSSRSSDGTITVGAVSSFDGFFIDDRSIPTIKIAVGAITSQELADGSVITQKVAPQSITNNELVGWQIRYIQPTTPTSPQLHDLWLDTTGTAAPAIPTGSWILDNRPLQLDGRNLIST